VEANSPLDNNRYDEEFDEYKAKHGAQGQVLKQRVGNREHQFTHGRVFLSANDGARLLLRQMSRRGGQGCRRNECTIRLLHKEGATDDRPQDWRPVVLNCTNQLVMHILNVRSRNIVEKAGILEPDQSGGRQGRSTDINLMMMPFICSCRNNK
jgi:hypothetical protein